MHQLRPTQRCLSVWRVEEEIKPDTKSFPRVCGGQSRTWPEQRAENQSEAKSCFEDGFLSELFHVQDVGIEVLYQQNILKYIHYVKGVICKILYDQKIRLEGASPEYLWL